MATTLKVALMLSVTRPNRAEALAVGDALSQHITDAIPEEFIRELTIQTTVATDNPLEAMLTGLGQVPGGSAPDVEGVMADEGGDDQSANAKQSPPAPEADETPDTSGDIIPPELLRGGDQEKV